MAVCMCLFQCELLFKKMSRICGIANCLLCKDNSCRVIAPSNSLYSADHSANLISDPKEMPGLTPYSRLQSLLCFQNSLSR